MEATLELIEGFRRKARVHGCSVLDIEEFCDSLTKLLAEHQNSTNVLHDNEFAFSDSEDILEPEAE